MQAIQCELCGSNALIKKDSLYMCEYCGTKYTPEEAKKLLISTTISIDGDVKIKEADFIIRAGTLEKYNGAPADVVIPNTVTHIGQNSFSGCSGLKSVKIPNSVTHIGKSAFSCCSSLTYIEVPNSLTVIEDNAFLDCINLTSIEIPDSVTTIGHLAFSGCKKLSKVIIPEKCKVKNDALTGTLFEKNKRKQLKLCQHCGGSFIGVFKKSCSECGKPKDY